jgi:hypothetical protein
MFLGCGLDVKREEFWKTIESSKIDSVTRKTMVQRYFSSIIGIEIDTRPDTASKNLFQLRGAPPPPRLLTSSHSHLLTLSPSHPLTLSPSHTLTFSHSRLTRCLEVRCRRGYQGKLAAELRPKFCTVPCRTVPEPARKNDSANGNNY